MKKFSLSITASSCQSLYWQRSCIPGENTHQCERLLAPVVVSTSSYDWTDVGLSYISPWNQFLPLAFTLFSKSFILPHNRHRGVNFFDEERWRCHNMWSSSWTWEHWETDWPCCYVHICRCWGLDILCMELHITAMASLQGHSQQVAPGHSAVVRKKLY